MRVRVIAVGTKMPSWVNDGCKEYIKRLPAEIKWEVIEIPLGYRAKNSDTARAIKQESDAILNAVGSDDWVVALEVTGKSWSTELLAKNMSNWQMDGYNLSILIGGPDGLSPECLSRANHKWSLSGLTLPHPLVRVLLAEQVYRGWTILAGHPYHR